MRLSYREEDGERLGSLLWGFGPGWRTISSAMLGGGIGRAVHAAVHRGACDWRDRMLP